MSGLANIFVLRSLHSEIGLLGNAATTELSRTGLAMRDRITLSARLSGRVIGKEYKTMARPKHQSGSLLVRGKRKKMYVARYYESVAGPDGKQHHVRRSILLGPVTQI